MKRLFFILVLIAFACKNNSDTNKKVDKPSADSTVNTNSKKNSKTYKVNPKDSMASLQQYYMVFLKRSGKKLDSLKNVKVTSQHRNYLKTMKEKGYANIHGSFADHGDIRQVVIYNTLNRKMADSLVKSDPAVKAGIYTVEIHPWWTEKGGKLQ